MKSENQKTQIEKVGNAYRQLARENPEQKKALDGGLLIVLSGGVPLLEGAISKWQVNTPHTYYIRLNGKPPRWSCTCPQGANFGPVAGNFFGHPGRICKHIAAVGICLMALEWPEQPNNLLAFIERVVKTGVAGEGEDIRDIPNGNKVKLVRIPDGALGLYLKQGRDPSDALAWYHIAESRWLMDPEAKAKYRQWVERIK